MTTKAPEVKPAVSVNRGHIGVLDLLRATASLFVVFYHFTSQNLLANFKSPLLDKVFAHGNLGVEMFFVVSGFVIPYSLYNASYHVADFGKYIAKRIIRIVPPAYFSIALQLGKWKSMEVVGYMPQSPLKTLTVEQLFKNLTFTYGFGDGRQINVVLWTLGVEFVFYLFIGVFYRELFAKNFPLFLGIFLLTSFIGLTAVVSNHSFFAYAPLFAIGGIVLLFYKQRISLTAYLSSLTVFFGISVSSIGFLASAVGVSTALAISFLKAQGGFFAFLGKISFSLYLIHNLVGSIANYLLAKFWHANSEPEAIAGTLVCVLFACLAAYAYYWVVEQPFLKLSRLIK